MEYIYVVSFLTTILCAVATAFCYTYVKYDAKQRIEAMRALHEEKIQLMESGSALQKTHNALVESQKTVIDRQNALELRLSGLVSSMPTQRKY